MKLYLPPTHAPFNQRQAFAEGWGIFDSRIQRLCRGPVIAGEPQSEEPVFGSDAEALEFVRTKAAGKSPYHHEALTRTKQL